MQTCNISLFPWQIGPEVMAALFRPEASALSPGSVLLLVLGAGLVITALLGFSFYLWYLRCNQNPTQPRLLNILNGYFSIFCMTGSVALYYSFGLTLQLSQEDDQEVGYQWSIRVSGVNLSAISLIFLLISVATITSHFRPVLSRIFKTNKSSYFRVKLKRIKFELYTEPDLDQT